MFTIRLLLMLIQILHLREAEQSQAVANLDVYRQNGRDSEEATKMDFQHLPHLRKSQR